MTAGRAHNASVRHLLIGLLLLLAVAPAATAKSFELPRGTGDLVFRASALTDAVVTISYIGKGARIIGPRGLTGVACREDISLHRCVRLRTTARGVEWIVRRPVRLWHQQEGKFSLAIRGRAELREVFISGCGTVALDGGGSYAADGKQTVSYTSDEQVVVDLKP